MESISIIKGATSVKKEAEKVQRQKSFFFAQIPPAFIQCTGDLVFMGGTKFWPVCLSPPPPPPPNKFPSKEVF